MTLQPIPLKFPTARFSPKATRAFGFTLLELLIVVVLLTILASFAVSTYSGYADQAKRTLLMQQIATIRVFQEDAWLRLGHYVAGTYDITNPGSPIITLSDELGWTPGNGNEVAYKITTTTNSYTVTASHQDGYEVSNTYP